MVAPSRIQAAYEQAAALQARLADEDAAIRAYKEQKDRERLAAQEAKNREKIAKLEAEGRPYNIVNGVVIALPKPMVIPTIDTTPLVSRDVETPAPAPRTAFLPESMRPPENTKDYILGIVNNDIPVDLKYDANKDGKVTREDIKPFIRNHIRNELETQYNNLVSYDPRLAYQGRSGDLNTIFNQQAEQLADAGVSSIANLGIKNNRLINRETGKVVTNSNLAGRVAVDRDTGVQKWGDIFSGVKGGANYGIQALEDGSVVLFPAWEKTKSPLAQIGLGGLESIITPLLTIGGAIYGGQAGAEAGAAVAGAAGGAAVGSTTGQLLATGEIDWEKVALSGALAGAGQYVGGLLSGGEAAAAGEAAGTGLTPGASEGFQAADWAASSAAGITPPAGFQLAPNLGASLGAAPSLLGPSEIDLLGGTDFARIGETGITGAASTSGSVYDPFATAAPGVGEGIMVIAPSVPGGAATVAGLEAPGLSGMGGAQGITVPIQGGGVVNESVFIPPGATPSLGDPGSFINNPDYLGSPVISEDFVAVPSAAEAAGASGAAEAAGVAGGMTATDALVAASILGGGQPQPQPYQSGYGAGRQMAGVDASGLLALLQSRAGVPGVAGLLAPVVNPYSLLG